LAGPLIIQLLSSTVNGICFIMTAVYQKE